jgi:CBS domain containing-hemolysin-like protein
MTAILIGLLLAVCVLIVLVTSVQVLYLESMRLRARDYASLEYFKEHIAERVGLRIEQGALTFSLIKHGLLILSGVLSMAVALWAGVGPLLEALAGALILGFVILVVASYGMPQILYRRSQGAWLEPLVPFYRMLALTASPLTWLMNFLLSLFELGNGAEVAQTEESSEQNIDALITAGEEEGLLEEEDRKLIESVVAFGDKTVREVMTPRPQIVAIQQDEPLEALRRLVINEQFSRIPVYEDSIDQIIGFVHVRDMFEMEEEERSRRKVKEIMRPIRLVPESKSVSDLMREMQQAGTHLAVVVDEYGNTAGLATMEDLVEEIVGEIHDEHEPERDVQPDGEGGFIVSGSFDLDRLHELLDFRPDEETESTTIGGLVAEWVGRVPAVGELVEREGLRVKILAGNDRRVDRVRVSRTLPPLAEEGA